MRVGGRLLYQDGQEAFSVEVTSERKPEGGGSGKMGVPSAATGKSQYRANGGLAWPHEVGDSTGTSKCQSQPPPTQPGPTRPDGGWRGACLATEINSHDPLLSAGGYVGHLDCRALPLRACPAPTLPSLVFSSLDPAAPRTLREGNQSIAVPLACL